MEIQTQANKRYNPNIDTAYEVSELIMSSSNLSSLVVNAIGVLAAAWAISKAASIEYEVAFLISSAIYLCSTVVKVVAHSTEKHRLNHEEKKWGYEDLQQQYLSLQQGTAKLKAKYLALDASSEQARQEMDIAQAKLSELEPKFKKAQSNVIHLSTLLEQARQELEQAGGNEEQAAKNIQLAALKGYKQGRKDEDEMSTLKRSIPQLKNEEDKAIAKARYEALEKKKHLG